MNLTALNFSELDPTTTIADFDCGDGDLNDFLCNDSIPYLNQLIAKTYIFSDESGIVAFFSISNDILTDKGSDPDSENRFKAWKKFLKGIGIPHKKRRKDFPAVKLGRLGVSCKIQSSGLGHQIIKLIIGLVLFQSKSASRFLIVDAYNNPRTIAFYTRNDFQFLLGDKDADQNTRIMFLDLLPYWNAASEVIPN